MDHRGLRLDGPPGAEPEDPSEEPSPGDPARPAADPARPADQVVVDYSLTSSDAFAAGVAATRYSILGNALGAALIASGLFTIVANGDWSGMIAGVIGLGMMSGIVFGAISAFMMGRRKDLMRLPYRLIVDGDGVRTETPIMNGDARWVSYKRVRPTRTTLLLELGTGAAVMVPRRALTPDQVERVLAWADVAGVLDPSSSLRPTLIGIALGIAFNVVIFASVVVSMNL